MSEQLRPSKTIQTGLAVAASQQLMEDEANIDEQIRAASLYIYIYPEFLMYKRFLKTIALYIREYIRARYIYTVLRLHKLKLMPSKLN